MLIKIASEWLGADLIFPILLPVHDTFQVLLVFSLTGRDIGALTGQNTESQPISPSKSQWGPSGSQILHFIIVHGLGLMRRSRGRHCLGQHRIPIPVVVKVPLPRIVVFPVTLEPPFWSQDRKRFWTLLKTPCSCPNDHKAIWKWLKALG